MQFPTPFSPDPQHRAGRMMLAGRVKVTCTSGSTDEHITIALKCFADNRDRKYAPGKDQNWAPCELAHATHIFVEVPRPDGGWADKVGTFYPKSNRWYDADNADPMRIHVAQLIGHWLCGHWDGVHVVTDDEVVGPLKFQEAEECGVCGRELTDPESISRGIGPVCFGNMTSSKHQVKGTTEEWDEYAQHEMAAVGSIDHLPPRPDGTEIMATTENKYGHGTNPSAPAQDDEEALGIEVPTGAVNALYSILDSMNLDQLQMVEEAVDALIIKRKDAAIALMRTDSKKNTDREALGR